MLIFKRYKNGVTEKLLSEIVNQQITGMVIEDTINEDEVNFLRNAINTLKTTFAQDLNAGNGYSLPLMFGQLYSTQPKAIIESYFQQIDDFCSAVNNASGINVLAWLQSKLSHYFSPYKSEILPGFLPYSFRIVFPNRGGLFIHKDGQLLPFIHEEVSTIIEQYILPGTMMSWYFTLQDPQVGGELWVADSEYSCFEKDGQFDMVAPSGEKTMAELMSHIKVKTPKGSLLMFNGGNYWHKVVPPAADDVERMTMGGFMALGIDEKTIYYWS